ncbi:MAG: HPr family phosphocarrier protein [Simkania negevensis]|nr:HPr family phosphocarrier protein [Simkania negevensis]
MEEKLQQTVKVKNNLGLHVRPASYIAKLLQGSKSKVTLTYKKTTINARSIMSIMILAAPKNARITICAQGVDAKVIIQKLAQAFEMEFEEG